MENALKEHEEHETTWSHSHRFHICSASKIYFSIYTSLKSQWIICMQTKKQITIDINYCVVVGMKKYLTLSQKYQ